MKTRKARTPKVVAALTGPRPIQSIVNTGVAYYHEAIATSEDRSPIRETPLSPRPVSTELSRLRMARIARTLYENGGFVGYAVDQIGNYACPILPQAATDFPDWNDEAEAVFAGWVSQADFLNRFAIDFYAMQRLVSAAIDLDGDVGVAAIGDAPEAAPRIQILEGHRIETPPKERTNPLVLDGVKIDAAGRVQGYFVSRLTSGRNGAQEITHEFMDTGTTVLLYEPSITTPLRGFSALRRGMNDMRDSRDIVAFEKLLVKQNAAMAGVIEGGSLDESSAFNLGSPEDEAAADPDATEGKKAMGRLDLTGGDIPVLPPGRTWKSVAVSRPNAGFEAFMDFLVGTFAAGLGIPPAFFLDSKLTGPNVRAVIGKAQRKFNERQKVIARFVQFTWVRVIGWAIRNGRLRPVPGWDRITYQRPPQAGIDLGDEAQADREDFIRGVKTRAEIWGKRGGDFREGTKALFAEDLFVIEEAQRVAKATGLPVDLLLRRHFDNPTTQPQQGQGNQQTNTNTEKK